MIYFKAAFRPAILLLLLYTLLCGGAYTAAVTGIAQLAFPWRANGSILEAGGVKYGSALLGQQYTDARHMWGRIMNLDVTTFQTKDGEPLLYAAPSNLSPAGAAYEALVKERVAMLRAANPERRDSPIPVDLVTCSGSGLDPHISVAAAQYQVARIAKARHISEDEVRAVIARCTKGKFLGLFGENVVNVLQVNLTLDGVL